MKIIGVGVDIIDNLRIKKSIRNKKFISRIFSKKEISHSKKIKDKVSKLGLSDNVKFLGYVDNPAEVIDGCDFYMCAMVGDDPGISGIQACQRKKPLIGIQTLSGFTSSPIKSSSSADEIAKMKVTHMIGIFVFHRMLNRSIRLISPVLGPCSEKLSGIFNS